MHGFIIVNAYTESQNLLFQAGRLQEEFNKMGVRVDIIRNNHYSTYFRNEGSVHRIEGYDFCIYLDKDPYAAEMIESSIPMFNKAKPIFLCDDKMETYIALMNEGIKMPVTVSAPICFDKNQQLPKEDIESIEKILDYPIIVKECHSSLGMGVFKADNRDELLSLMERTKMIPHLYQEFIQESEGRDIRVILIGHHVVGAMERVNRNDFRSNIALGGMAHKVDLSEKVTEFCEKTARLLDLDYCGMDILMRGDEPYLCEVNSNAFFQGFEPVTGKNIAKIYAEYILSELKNR